MITSTISILPFLQDIDKATELLTTKEITVIGVLTFILVVTIFATGKLYLRIEKLNELRISDHKEYTKEILSITAKTSETIRQLNEILKISKTE